MANPVCAVLLSDARLTPSFSDADSGSGAVVQFAGVVRGLEDGRDIDGIEYEAHPTMAEHQMRLLAQKAIERFGLRAIVLQHRIGFVPVSETSLFLRVSSGHRSEAFAAAQWIVDELKQRVPIWKRPRFKKVASGQGNAVDEAGAFDTSVATAMSQT